MEASWEAHTDYIRTVERLVRPVVNEELSALTGAINAGGRRIVVFNPLPWQRDGVATVRSFGASFNAVQDVAGKAVTPTDVEGDRVRFFARNIPPLGYRTYVPADTQGAASRVAVDTQAATMENDFFKLRLDAARGVVVSLVDKHTGRELVDSSAPHALGQYLYERFDADQAERYVMDYTAEKISNEGARAGARVCFGKPNLPRAAREPYRATSPQGFKVRFEHTPLAAAAVMAAAAGHGMPQPVTVRLVMYQDQPYIDIEVTLHDKPLEPWPEAGWLCLPMKVEQPAFKLGRLGAVTDLERDTVPGSNRDVLCLNHGEALIDSQGAGVGIYAMDSPLVSFERTGLYRYSRNFMPKKSWAYVNLFNNTWSTNFRDWLGGTWTSRVRLWAICHYDAEQSLVTPALESRCPLLATTTDAPPGKLSTVQTGLGISKKGRSRNGFRRQSGRSGHCLCLWEQAGRSGNCEVRLPVGMKVSAIRPIDLRGRPSGAACPFE